MNPTESLREQERLRDAIALALVKLAEHNVPPDTQEMLLAGNHETKPGALNSVVKALLPTHQPSEAGDGGWRPTSSPPKKGVRVLLAIGQRIEAAEWCGSEWEGDVADYKQHYPTHWMPLPQPPAAKTGGE